jgi:AraC-like DNA-binding protein
LPAVYAFGMAYLTRPACGPLAGLVELLWLYDGPPQPHQFERLLPDGSMELVVNLLEDEVRVYDPARQANFERLPGSVLVGPHSQYFVIDTAEQQSVAGVHFCPGGASAFLSLPAAELHGLHVSLADLWGTFAAELRDRLLGARTPEARLAIMEAALLARLNRDGRRHPAVAYALGQFHAAPHSLGEVTEATGLSTRRMIDLFQREVGLAPKRYCRVRRFQNVIRRVSLAPSVDWSALALDCGYCDQAHLVHEFRAISGLTPTAYLALRTPHLNHVPMAG